MNDLHAAGGGGAFIGAVRAGVSPLAGLPLHAGARAGKAPAVKELLARGAAPSVNTRVTAGARRLTPLALLRRRVWDVPQHAARAAIDKLLVTAGATARDEEEGARE